MTLFEQYSAKRLYGNQTRVDNLIRQYAFTGDRLALPHVECLQGQYYSKRKLWQPQSRIQHDFESSGKKQVLIDTFDNRIDEALQIDPDTAHKTVFFQNIVRVSFWYFFKQIKGNKVITYTQFKYSVKELLILLSINNYMYCKNQLV